MKLKILLLFLFVSLYAKEAPENPRTVYVVTWNVGEENPPGSVKELLGQISSKDELNPDIIIVGLQEVTMNPIKALKNKLVGDKWSEDIDDILKSNNNYAKIYSESLLGMLLKVYVRIKYKVTLSKEKDATTVKTGVKGFSGNKGAVIIKFKLNELSYCVVNSHLPAHDEKLEERIDDYKTINRERGKFCGNSDYVFWLGDLNFRLDESLKDEKIRELVKQKKFNELLQKDQLKVNHETKEIFGTFNEQEIKFAPTFKLEKGKGEYSKQRRPAWTDRVLYKSDTSKIIKPTLYQSITSYIQSDHYPVQAQFFIANK
uniref:Pc29, similar to salivary inositol polyphosphate 5-phosphatase n=1 Tax=Panstrongylus chinai TaxID=156444 RepID=A0A286T5N5_9HEMI|nr:Pc29, similar to salivary inositol polyphosphate 5-phosphatase [Panstrongylus chinai]